jgi:hypothetical protein
MSWILSAQRDGGPDDAARAWQDYQRYLRDNAHRFPPGAFALATSDWYHGFSDPRAPHDAWLEWARFEEPASGDRRQNRQVSLRIRLLGAYHDHALEFYYPTVYAYTLDSANSAQGHGDWRYDEFRLSAQGRLIHEIEWSGLSGQARWLIEASDVEFTAQPLAA